MRKSDVETSYHQGHRYRPMVNVKNSLWLPDLFRKYEGTGEHEFSDDAGFWAWLHEIYDRSDYDALDGPDEWARELCWELAQEAADEIWKDLPFRYGRNPNGATHPVKVWSAGRSGGWCVVEGLDDIEYWDAIELGRWARFVKAVKVIAFEEYPYQFIWHCNVNVWEHERDQRAGAYPAPNYEGSIA